MGDDAVRNRDLFADTPLPGAPRAETAPLQPAPARSATGGTATARTVADPPSRAVPPVLRVSAFVQSARLLLERNLGLLWIAHRAGNVLTLRQLHAAVKLRIDQIEWMLDTMSAALWIGRTGSGWALIKDPREISIADVYRLFVFRGGPRIADRRTGREIDAYAQKLALRVEEHMQLSLEAFYTAANDTEKVPPVEDDPDQTTPAA